MAPHAYRDLRRGNIAIATSASPARASVPGSGMGSGASNALFKEGAVFSGSIVVFNVNIAPAMSTLVMNTGATSVLNTGSTPVPNTGSPA